MVFLVGIFGVPVEIVANQMQLAVTQHMKLCEKSTLREILLVDISDKFLKILQCEFLSVLSAEKHLTHVTGGTELHAEGVHQATKKSRDVQTRGQVSELASGENTCSICMGQITKAETLACKHTFCRHCIPDWKKQKPTCPECGDIFGEITGTQPKGGRMTHDKTKTRLPGHEHDSTGTIRVFYDIPAGIQTVCCYIDIIISYYSMI